VNENPQATESGRTRRRRRRRRGGEGRGSFSSLLPHLLTTGNLAAGFYAIVKASEGDLDRAALAVVVAIICDILDGRAARRAGATSRFGAEYDSIADTVSFGVAPAIIAFNAGVFQELGWTGWVLAFMYTACAGLRLARFNVSPGRYAGRFEGLPSPAAAGTVISTVWFASFMRESGMPLDPAPILPGLGVALLGLLMISPIPYHSLKGFGFHGQRSIILAVIGLVVMLSKPSLTFFLFGIGYVSSGPIEWLWRIRTGHPLAPQTPGAAPEERSGGAT